MKNTTSIAQWTEKHDSLVRMTWYEEFVDVWAIH